MLNRFTTRLDDQEKAWLLTISNRSKLSENEILRRLVRRAAGELKLPGAEICAAPPERTTDHAIDPVVLEPNSL